MHRIQFPKPLKAALRDGRLVVFAGAGVSKGEPACLPDFRSLACRIAKGTGSTLTPGEPVDQFLGRLHQNGSNVHELAAHELSGDDLAPTELHRDLLRLYPNEASVRIVTTNFDLLFELAAQSLSLRIPELYRGPALPLGHDFTGLVQVHGAVSQPTNMVLTDAGFGRAYLTDGWARRFLTGLFRTFTVLFVGYAHNDAVMRYMARALPESQAGKRFVLTPQRDDDPERWQLLGVEPIPYVQASDHDHSMLYREVHRLAHYMSRSILDWQREITEIAAKAAPDCPFAKSELRNVSARHPEWEPREHPDLTHWIGEAQSWTRGSILDQSPWTVDELLERPGQEWQPELLSFQPTGFDRIDRDGLLHAVETAAKSECEWGLGLAYSLVETEKWDTDLWPPLMRAWSTTELDENRHRKVLALLAAEELYGKHSNYIADYLYSLVKDGGKSYVLKVLPQANAIGCDLRRHLVQEEPPEEREDWLTTAINHPAGKLAEYWLRSLSIFRSQNDSATTPLADEYLAALSEIILDRSLSGRLGRVVLAAHFSFLVAIDEDWTRENILPLFYVRDDIGDFQAAWHGFLHWGRLGPTAAELLSPAFFEAVPRTKTQLFGCRDRFVGHYVSIITYFIEDPIREWIPKLFDYADSDVKKTFALEVWQRLRSMDDAQQIKQWNRWLKPYWKGRLQGKPRPLEADEIKVMLQWLPTLQAVFPETVELAVRMPVSQLNFSMLIFDIDRKKLWQKYPEDVARLLIHLGNSGSPGYMWHRGRKLVDNLLGTDLSPARKQGLKELIARLDLR